MSFFGGWVTPKKQETPEGVEEDPVQWEHSTKIRRTVYKGPPPHTHEQIEEYRARCNAQCEEILTKGSVEWSKCANACSREVSDLAKNAWLTNQKMMNAEMQHFSQEQR